MKKYFYSLLHKYISLFILPENSVVEIDPNNDYIIRKYDKGSVFFRKKEPKKVFQDVIHAHDINENSPDYILINGIVHYERDIHSFFCEVHKKCTESTRVIITYYSFLWKPVMTLATYLGIRTKSPESNWITNEDVGNLLLLSDFETVRVESRVLIPIWIPVISKLFNQFISPLPFFRIFNLVNILVARPVFPKDLKSGKNPGVSIVVAARNEAGNIENIVKRLPQMSNDDELIFVEGNSTDNTWNKIEEVQNKYRNIKKIVIARQDGKGKGDAVRKGFNLATKDILMILDADMTVPPEDLPQFYNTINSGKGEFINGSRLVYPMEKKAMRFFNILGNKFFALAFSFVLGQPFKDTLCGTKVLSRENYLRIAKHRSFFGDFDPFGDFDLIFGAARLCLKIVEVPIVYRERTYGTTNISRWSHGTILLAMLLFAARKIKFI